MQVLKPARRPRKKMVSFAGGFLFWQDPGGLRSEMRDKFRVRQSLGTASGGSLQVHLNC